MSAMHRKSYNYCYPTSRRAVELGHGETGCFYIGRETRREDGGWNPPTVWPGTEGEAADTLQKCGSLRDLYAEIDAPVSPWGIQL